MIETAAVARFRVLGPLEVEMGGEPVRLGAPKHRAVLALLLLHPGRTVSVPTIGDAVWGDDRLPAFQASLHVAVSALRRSLRGILAAEGARLETVAPGYRLTAAPGSFDLESFRLTRDRGLRDFRAGRPEQAAAECRAALRLFRGRPLDDLGQFGFADEFAVAVEEERLATLQIRIEADLQCGRQDSVLGELMDLTRRYPLREHFWAQLAVAYYRLDRQAEALGCLGDLRRVLGTELGIDPSPAVQRLELDILRQELPAQLAARGGVLMTETIAETDSTAYGWLVSPWGSSYPITDQGIQIGRSPENDITLADDRVSRRHALIEGNPAGIRLSDLGSTNGTYLNGERISAAEEYPIRAGDVVGIGRSDFTVGEDVIDKRDIRGR